MNSIQSEKEKEKKSTFCLDQVQNLEKCIKSWENFSQPNHYCRMDVFSLKWCSQIDEWLEDTVRRNMEKSKSK